jgi:hypothetical protein
LNDSSWLDTDAKLYEDWSSVSGIALDDAVGLVILQAINAQWPEKE